MTRDTCRCQPCQGGFHCGRGQVRSWRSRSLPRHGQGSRSRCPRDTSGEIGKVAIGKVAPDRRATRPDAANRRVVLGAIKIGQRAIGPVVEPLAFRAIAHRQALPDLRRQRLGDVSCFTGNGALATPRRNLVSSSPTPYTLSATTQANGTRATIACRLGPHPAGLARFVAEQRVKELARRGGNPILPEQRPDAPLGIAQRRRPQRQRFLNRRATTHQILNHGRP